MQPNNPNNPYSRVAVPNYGGQPIQQYPQMPPNMMVQQGVPMPQANMRPPVAVPRQANMTPGVAIPNPVPEGDQTVAHERTTLADGTVLPDVIYVKKKGAKIAFAITLVLLIACGAYAGYASYQLITANKKNEELASMVKKKDSSLEMVKNGLGVESLDELTEEQIKEMIHPTESVFDLDLTTFNNGSGIGINMIRVSPDHKYALADVSYYGTSSYYYHIKGQSGWKMAFSKSSVVSCRDVSLEAMEILVELGGVSKSVSASGKQYDCLDPQDGDKLYDFADAIEAKIYSTDN